jgi:acetyl esterase/lipase
MQSNQKQPGVFIPARFIPTPRTVSPQAQHFLSNPPPMGNAPAPGPKDKAGWRAYVEAIEPQLTALSKSLAASHPGEIVTRQLSAARLYEVTPQSFSTQNEKLAILYVHGGGFTVGGGIAASFVLKARDIGLPLPAVCVLHSPEADLTESGDTFETNDKVDIILSRLTNSIALYADGHDLRDPYMSPVFGNFDKGFPPTILTSGTRDLFLSNTVILHRALRRAGIKAELHVWEAMPHGGFFGTAPEDEEVLGEQVRFMKAHLGVE